MVIALLLDLHMTPCPPVNRICLITLKQFDLIIMLCIYILYNTYVNQHSSNALGKPILFECNVLPIKRSSADICVLVLSCNNGVLY